MLVNVLGMLLLELFVQLLVEHAVYVQVPISDVNLQFRVLLRDAVLVLD